jgi:gluconokinase
METSGTQTRCIRIVILMGVSGSGKTTIGHLLAKQLGWQFYEGDNFHSVVNIDKMRQGIALHDEDREPWLHALQTLIHDLLKQSEHAVITCSALRQVYRKRLMEGHSHVAFVYLRGSYSLIFRRLQSRRGHFMNPDLLLDQFRTLEEPDDVPRVEIDQSPGEIVRQITAMLELAPG